MACASSGESGSIPRLGGGGEEEGGVSFVSFVAENTSSTARVSGALRSSLATAATSSQRDCCAVLLIARRRSSQPARLAIEEICLLVVVVVEPLPPCEVALIQGQYSRCSATTSSRAIGGGDEEEDGEEGLRGEEGGEVVVGLKSQSPRRRKHAAQLARPEMVDGSACQPNAARVSAEVSIGGAWVEGVGDVVGGISDGGDGERRKGEARLDMFIELNEDGVDIFEGSSVDMAARDS